VVDKEGPGFLKVQWKRRRMVNINLIRIVCCLKRQHKKSAPIFYAALIFCSTFVSRQKWNEMLSIQ